MVKKAMMAVMAVLVVLFMVGTASADTTITLDSLTKDVPIGGTVDFTVTLSSDTNGSLQWDVAIPADPITAKIAPGAFAKSGNVGVTVPPNVQIFTLTVKAEDGAVVGQKYKVKVKYFNTEQDLEAMATAGTIPTPELSTSILTAAGLIGLIGLVRYRRKD